MQVFHIITDVDQHDAWIKISDTTKHDADHTENVHKS
jgi:hypothetical protein